MIRWYTSHFMPFAKQRRAIYYNLLFHKKIRYWNASKNRILMRINDARNSIVIPIKCILLKECWLEFWLILLLINAKYNIGMILLFKLNRIILLLQQLYVFRTYCEIPALKWSCDVLSKIYPWHKYAIRDKAIHLLPFHVNQEFKLCKNRFSREILVINIIHYQVVLKYHYLYIHHFTNNKPCLKFFLFTL